MAGAGGALSCLKSFQHFLLRFQCRQPSPGLPFEAPDLRGGAALVVAGLCAEGKTEIGGVEYIERGYECIESTLTSIGADIKKI